MNGGHITHQVVARKRLKTMEKKPSRHRSQSLIRGDCLQEVLIYYRDLTGKVLVFLIGYL